MWNGISHRSCIEAELVLLGASVLESMSSTGPKDEMEGKAYSTKRKQVYRQRDKYVAVTKGS